MCHGTGRGRDSGRLTIHVTLYVRVGRLVVLDDLDDPQQVLFLELLERLGDLLEVVLLRRLLARANLLLVVRQRARLAEDLLQRLARVLERDGVRHVVAGRLKVQVMVDCLLLLLGDEAVDLELELSPAFVLALVGRLQEGWRPALDATVDLEASRGGEDSLWSGFSNEG